MARFTVNTQRFDPYKNFKFRVKWNGRYVAGISKAGSFNRSSEHEAITLERGVTHDADFEAWASKVWTVSPGLGAESALKNFCKNLTIEVYNEVGQLALAYKVHRCWVSEYQASSDLDANVTAVAIQHIRLENEGWERVMTVAAPAGAATPAAAEQSPNSDSMLLHGRTLLDQLAQRMQPVARWEQLRLPAAEKALLRELAAQMKQRSEVYAECRVGQRLNRSMGISVLFVGEGGTGKTMAAAVLAHELQLPIYSVDLSAMVSKYIGETEKKLRELFDAAEHCGAILYFDEADAMFGKRSDIKDSQDRYVNIEVSYLLQRMESYRGLAILTTKCRSAMDRAILHRLHFIVNFPVPAPGGDNHNPI